MSSLPGLHTADHLRAVDVRGTLLALVIALLGLAASAASPASAAVAGDLDADVIDARSGKRLGSLHGSVDGRRGFAVVIPGRRSTGQTARVWLGGKPLDQGRRPGPATWRLTGSEGGFEIDLVLDGHKLKGTGRTRSGRRIEVVGYGGIRRPDAGKGTLLRVGKLPGEVRDSLKRNYRLRRVSARRFSRERVLDHPRLLDGVAGIVIGRDVRIGTLRNSGLLRTLANGHRWVVVAHATNKRLTQVRGTLPVTRVRRAAPAVALRLSGVKGGSDAARSVIVFPGPPAGRVSTVRGAAAFRSRVDLPERVERRLRRARVSFFARELRRAGRPHVTRKTRVAQQGGDLTSQCTQAGQTSASSAVASCYQIDVTGLQQMAMPAPGNIGPFCLWPGKGGSTDMEPLSCPGSSGFDSIAGGSPDGGPAYVASSAQFETVCEGARPDYYTAIAPSVGPMAVTAANPLAGGFAWGTTLGGYNVYSYTECPENPSQIATYSTTDTYFALYEPDSSQQGILTQVSGSVTPNSGSKTGGPAIVQSNGEWNPPLHGNNSQALDETAWVLAGAETQAGYTPPTNASTSQAFEYEADNSFPGNPITNETVTNSSTTTSGFNVGVSVAEKPGVNFKWSQETVLNTQTEVTVPDWTVVPNVPSGTGGATTAVYAWQSNTPLTYTEMQCFPTNVTENNPPSCGQPFGAASLNSQNTNTWSPSSQTTWSGDQTGGTAVGAVNHEWDFADHYSAFAGSESGSGSVYPTPYLDLSPVDVFQQAQFSQSDSSDATTQFGSQEIDLCDPLVTGNGDFSLC